MDRLDKMRVKPDLRLLSCAQDGRPQPSPTTPETVGKGAVRLAQFAWPSPVRRNYLRQARWVAIFPNLLRRHASASRRAARLLAPLKQTAGWRRRPPPPTTCAPKKAPVSR